VELYWFCRPEDSEAAHEQLTRDAEAVPWAIVFGLRSVLHGDLVLEALRLSGETARIVLLSDPRDIEWLLGPKGMGVDRVAKVDDGDEDLVEAVLGFARQSTTLMGVAVATGVMQMYVLDGFALFTSGHGRLNILTILVTAAMIWIALMVKAFAQSRLRNEDGLSGKMAWRLRRAVRVELIAGIVVFGITAWAVPTNPPQAKAESTRPAVNYAFRQELENDRFKVVLSITPVETGVNAMRIELLKPSRISDFTVNLIPQEVGYEGIAIKPGLKRPGAVIIAGDGLFMLKAPGVWSIEVTGATTTGELVPLATTINVAQGQSPETTVAPTTTVGG